VFPALVVAFVSFVMMFAGAVTGLVASVARPVLMMALESVIVVAHGRPGRLGGSSRLGRGDIPGVCQRSGAEEVLRMMVSPGLRPGRLSGQRRVALSESTADNDLLAGVSELSGGLCPCEARRDGPAMHLKSRRMAIGLLATLAVSAAEARADDHRDHDVARQAVERGEIKPLAEILQAVRDKLPGEIAGVKIEREGGRLTYELRIVGARGRLLKVHVDAATGEIGRIREK
jgi:hypothetical protein